MIEQEFFDNLMLDLLEDRLGLWEVDGLARKELVHLPDEERSQRAKALVNDCLSRGRVNIFERQVTYLPGKNAEYGPPIPVEPARIAGILSDKRVWDYDAIGERRAGSSFA